MATTRETNVVYGAGVVQGIVLVTFPAASTILTDPDEYDLSNTQYGLLFLPQVVTAIAASLLGAWLGRRFSTKRVYLCGLVAGLTSMTLLFVSQFFESNTSVALPLLLLATAFLGLGFGASAAYLTVSETWPIEIRAEAIAVFFAIAQIFGALGPAHSSTVL